MTNEQKYITAFMEAFEIEEDMVRTLEFQAIPAWDSVGHMGLITALEDAFDIMMEPDDIIELSSFQKGKEILAKYNVNF